VLDEDGYEDGIEVAGVVQFQIPNGMMDGRHVPDLDMLSMYGQDDLHQSVFAAGNSTGKS
jgi:hypothetical protein